MVRILDKFYTSPEYIYEKGALCTLRHVQSERVNLVDNTHQPTIIIISLDAVSSVSQEVIDDVVDNYKLCRGNKIVIDRLAKKTF